MSTAAKVVDAYAKIASMGKVAQKLGIAKSTVYYHLVKTGTYEPRRKKGRRGGQGNRAKPVTKITPPLAEFLGMHTGDGSWTAGSWWIKSGFEEILYCQDYVSPLLNHVFQVNTHASLKWCPSHRTPRSVIRNQSAALFRTLEHFGFKSGSKAECVRVPQAVFDANESVRKAFLRGLFDTDGSIGAGFDRRPIIVAVYTISEGLAIDVNRLINGLGIKTRKITTGRKTRRVALCRSEYAKWMSDVGTSNLKYATKWEMYKKIKKFPPHTTLRGRLKLLGRKEKLQDYLRRLRAVGFHSPLSKTDEKLLADAENYRFS